MCRASSTITTIEHKFAFVEGLWFSKIIAGVFRKELDMGLKIVLLNFVQFYCNEIYFRLHEWKISGNFEYSNFIK